LKRVENYRRPYRETNLNQDQFPTVALPIAEKSDVRIINVSIT